MRAVLSLVLLSALTAGCSNIDVEKVLQVTDVSTGWYDAGIVNGKNKLVPSASLRLKNISSEPVASVQLNAIFRRVNEQEAWGEHFVRAIGPEALAPGATTDVIVLMSNLGYTGEQPRGEMLRNAQFIDAKVDIFGKHGSRTWVRLTEQKIDRRLLTQ
jgi:hypothetical protein